MTLRSSFVALCSTLIALAISMPAQTGSPSTSVGAQEKSPTSKIIEKDLASSSPVQWRLNADNRNVGIFLVGVAWGPADAPVLISKASEAQLNQKPDQFSDRPYVIALGFQARMLTPLLDMRTRSGLVRIKDADGNIDLPWDLTVSGFVRKDLDIHFTMGNVTTQYWDFFPVPAGQKEFLFKVHSPAQSVQYFTVVLKDSNLSVINSTPTTESACLQFDKSLSGSIGADSLVRLQLKRQNQVLSGTEQYAKVGKTLWLTGTVDSLGYFTLQESYPKDHATGILKGKFDAGFETMSGYFSKPDGSQLLPFDFHELQPTGTEGQSPSSNNCETEGPATPPAR